MKEESAAMLIPLSHFVYTSSGSNSRSATFTTSASRAADILHIVAGFSIVALININFLPLSIKEFTEETILFDFVAFLKTAGKRNRKQFFRFDNCLVFHE